jgi:chemotaxis protein methyltransferase CheR
MESTVAISQRDFTRISEFIYKECGINLPPVKKTMLAARLQKRLRGLEMKSFGDYIDYLFSPDGIRDEMVRMIDLVTTNKTDFFREPEHFDYLVQRVLPEWVDTRAGGAGRRLKVWSAGCSSGEEPYTLAMVLSEFAESCPGLDFGIMATDISTRVLETARLAIYDEERVAPVPLPLKRKYLLRSRDKNCGQVRIAPGLREKVRFSRLNFMESDFGLREQIDIIFCRNVIIYFDRPTQERLLNKFHTHLAPGGHIFMGHSETLNGLDVPLEMVHPTIYRRRK